jgi:hypothetical protein
MLHALEIEAAVPPENSDSIEKSGGSRTNALMSGGMRKTFEQSVISVVAGRVRSWATGFFDLDQSEPLVVRPAALFI